MLARPKIHHSLQSLLILQSSSACGKLTTDNSPTNFDLIINHYIYIHTKAMRKEPCGFYFFRFELNQFTA